MGANVPVAPLASGSGEIRRLSARERPLLATIPPTGAGSSGTFGLLATLFTIPYVVRRFGTLIPVPTPRSYGRSDHKARKVLRQGSHKLRRGSGDPKPR